MSQENVNAESFWRGQIAYNEGDWDAALATMDPDVVHDLTHVAPDGEIYRGYEGVKVFWRMLREVFGDFRVDPVEVFEWGHCVFTRVRLSGAGTASGAMTEDVLYQVVTLRQGRAIRVDFFRERGEALEAVGLRE
jgi:ketosteroid isomerase-like protein